MASTFYMKMTTKTDREQLGVRRLALGTRTRTGSPGAAASACTSRGLNGPVSLCYQELHGGEDVNATTDNSERQISNNASLKQSDG